MNMLCTSRTVCAHFMLYQGSKHTNHTPIIKKWITLGQDKCVVSNKKSVYKIYERRLRLIFSLDMEFYCTTSVVVYNYFVKRANGG